MPVDAESQGLRCRDPVLSGPRVDSVRDYQLRCPEENSMGKQLG